MGCSCLVGNASTAGYNDKYCCRGRFDSDRYTAISLKSLIYSQGWVELEAKQANTPFVWLGLHYSCTLVFWFWVDDHRLEYTHWDSGKKIDECDTSAAMAVNGGLWANTFVQSKVTLLAVCIFLSGLLMFRFDPVVLLLLPYDVMLL
uniref:C-type lectin domain-containing protein n=1 Tax=Monopterus albus TaxID=43700 RepID=A0A3Q3IP05_MONAL